MTSFISTAADGELQDALRALGEPEWRARQIRDAVWQPYVKTFAGVRQLPASLRGELAQRYAFSAVANADETPADGGLTVKLLCRLHDGETIETVAMETPASRYARRRSTVCVSSQVGCAVGCPFCATGRMGLRRNCSAAEIVDQVRAASASLHAHGLGPVTHVVYMGMGEPLANLDAVVESLHVLVERAGVSPRRITVSTSGVVPAIERLADTAPPVTLAISLHAATDELRIKLVPLNRAHPIRSLVVAGVRYAQQTGRRLTFEWCLIGGVNDSLDQARALRRLAQEAHAHINVIPMNHIEGSPWGPPSAEVSRSFLEALSGVAVTVRDTRGNEADAACGQLRALLEARRELRPDGTLGPPRRLPVA
ncbi:MAG: 23S rRNA (adenine(2503)-C(2))-methyltransferase RlmN [Candidatus Dormibacteria bacterium]